MNLKNSFFTHISNVREYSILYSMKYSSVCLCSNCTDDVAGFMKEHEPRACCKRTEKWSKVDFQGETKNYQVWLYMISFLCVRTEVYK